MKQKKSFFKLLFSGAVIAGVIFASAQVMFSQEESSKVPAMPEGQVLPLAEFIYQASEKDSEFEKILIDELALQYQKDLTLPAKDLVVEVKSEYQFLLDQDREEPKEAVSLSKLFPLIGTNIGVDYTVTPSLTSTTKSSDVTLEISQPIASNAFGKATRLKDKIVGIEIDVAKHQIVEAYEDYLSVIIAGYYDWYEAYENMQVGESSYKENLKLLDNIRERQKSNIALPIDVNKVHLQVLAKREKLIQLQEDYAKALNFIEKAIRYDGGTALIPQAPKAYKEVAVSFDEDFASFQDNSRTYQVLNMLEEKSTLDVAYEADDLLPSIDLLLGYQVKGEEFRVTDENSLAYAGISVEWPLGHQVDKAEYQTAKIALQKRQLTNDSTHYKLYKELKDLSLQMESEKQFVEIAEEKIALAKSILEDETENYSFGKVTLNDYIDAVNVFDTNRFNQIAHDAEYKRLLIEWLRLTDKLITLEEIQK